MTPSAHAAEPPVIPGRFTKLIALFARNGWTWAD